MFRIDNDTSTGSLPTPEAVGPNPDSYFTEGDPGSAIPATIVTADWLNAVQEEIAYVIEQAGDTLDKTDQTQLYTAIDALITAAVAPSASESTAGIAEIATQAEALTGTDDARMMTPLKTTKLFSDTGRQSLATNGYQKLPGGLIIQWGTTADISSASSETVTLPVTFPTAILNLSVTRRDTSAGSTAYAFYGNALSTSQIVVYNGAGSTFKGYWIAIGY